MQYWKKQENILANFRKTKGKGRRFNCLRIDFYRAKEVVKLKDKYQCERKTLKMYMREGVNVTINLE